MMMRYDGTRAGLVGAVVAGRSIGRRCFFRFLLRRQRDPLDSTRLGNDKRNAIQKVQKHKTAVAALCRPSY